MPPNGKSPSKGKGKAKEDALPAHQGKDDDLQDPMNIDEIEYLSHEPEDENFGLPASTSQPNGVPRLSIRDADLKRAQRQLQQVFYI
jgi:hypothetical protein